MRRVGGFSVHAFNTAGSVVMHALAERVDGEAALRGPVHPTC